MSAITFQRHAGQRIVIGDCRQPIAVITIADVSGDRVLVRIEAPPEITVDRGEVSLAKAKARKMQI